MVQKRNDSENDCYLNHIGESVPCIPKGKAEAQCEALLNGGCFSAHFMH